MRRTLIKSAQLVGGGGIRHADLLIEGERIARIDKPVLREKYGSMIVDFHEVDSLVDDPDNPGEKVGVKALKASKVWSWRGSGAEGQGRQVPRLTAGSKVSISSERGSTVRFDSADR